MPFRSSRASSRAGIALAMSTLGLATLGLSATGCPDPEQTFDDFGERYEALDPQQGSSTSSGPIGGCLVPEVGGEVDGTYMFALSPGQLGASVAKKPLLFAGQITIVEGAAGVEMGIVLTGLGTPYRPNDDSIEALQPVGAPIDLGTHPLAADGTFVAELPEISVPGQANPVSPGTLAATVTLRGQVCANAEGDGEIVLGFFCGTVEGVVTEPTDITLEASKNTFTFTKYEGELPTEVTYNCAGDPANSFTE